MLNLSYKERAEKCENLVSKKLFLLMENKKTNLSLSADVTNKKALLSLAETLGPQICVLKTHIDIIEDFDIDLTKKLRTLADKHHFLIFEDRKFADIGNTVKHQYAGGIYHIADWADIINAHTVPGPGIIQGLAEVGLSKNRALLLLAEMSSQGTLAHGDYTKTSVKMAKAHKDFVIGFISRRRLCNDPSMIHMTPGVKLESGTDPLGQQYLTPETVIAQQKNDIIIVGRGIIEADDPLSTAKIFRQRAWKAYETSLMR